MTQVSDRDLPSKLTVNEQLLSRSIRHHVMVMGYANGESGRIEKLLRAVQRDLEAKIVQQLRRIRERGYDLGPVNSGRLRALYAAVDEILTEEYSSLYRENRDELFGFAVREAAFEQRVLQSVIPIEVATVVPPIATLRSAVTTRPFQGNTLRQWYGSLKNAQRQSLRRSINMGVVEGESIEQITTRIVGTRGVQYRDGALSLGRRQARAVVRTAVNSISTQAREMVYEQNKSLIKGVQMVATLDGRTTPFCRQIDGKVFDVGEGPRPPFHVNCRTATVPIVRSLRELGIADIGRMAPSTRASMNGQVSASLNYPQWFKQQSAGFQREVLGASRYRMYQSGLTNVTRFADREGRLYTLPELYGRERSIASAANLV
tara:strand:- start:3446 stop:4570 length:1125 start_codon:yes stop_codon:yes gene_type:complete